MVVHGYKPENALKANIAIRDKKLCEIFGWDIFQIYKQPMKRITEFCIIIDEEAKMQREENDKIKRESRHYR